MIPPSGPERAAVIQAGLETWCHVGRPIGYRQSGDIIYNDGAAFTALQWETTFGYLREFGMDDLVFGPPMKVYGFYLDGRVVYFEDTGDLFASLLGIPDIPEELDAGRVPRPAHPRERDARVAEEIGRFYPGFEEKAEVIAANRMERAISLEPPGQFEAIDDMKRNHIDDVGDLYLGGEYLFLIACTEGAWMTGRQATLKLIARRGR